jgi:FAD/FMN-containing dehydrogenase
MQVEADALAVTGALSPWASGSAYLNFAENELDASIAYSTEAWDRLRTVKSTVDPDGLFLGNHAIPRR